MARVGSTGRRNTARFAVFREGSRWRARVGLACRRSRSGNSGSGGRTASRLATSAGREAEHAASVFGVLAAKGGIAPPDKTRSQASLTTREREEISRDLAAGLSFHRIAARLGRAPSTVSREVGRNDGRACYRATGADGRAWAQAARPKPCLLAVNKPLQALVAEKLQAQWSPEQVSGWLKAEHAEDEAMRVSHENIYKSLFIQARGVLRKELVRNLRSRRLMPRAKTSTTEGQPRGRIIDAVSIRERPAEVEDRAVPGHLEGDLISGAKNSHVATLVERQSRFVVLVQVDGKDSSTVVDALIGQIRQLPAMMMSSLTWDRGTELAHHARLTVATDVAVYFCDPRSPWQRGSNENTNGLLRQYFPKGTDLSAHSQADLDAVALKLNTRPRKTLGFQTPGATLAQAVAATG